MNKSKDSKIVTRNSKIVNDYLNVNYNVGNEIIHNTEVLKSDFCDYNDAYILVRGKIVATTAPNTQASFQNCIQFTMCIKKIYGTTMDDMKDLDLVLSMYSLIEYN